MGQRKSLRIAVLLAFLFTVTAGAAYAGFEYCGDPVLDVGGEILYIIVGVPEAVLPLIDSEHPIKVVVRVPEDLKEETVRIDSDRRFKVKIREVDGEGRIVVEIQAPEFRRFHDYPVLLTVYIPSLGICFTEEGTSDGVSLTIGYPAFGEYEDDEGDDDD